MAKRGMTRRELMKGFGVGAVASGLLGASPARAAGGKRTVVLGPRAVPLTLRVNGKEHALSVEPRVTLLEALRDELGLTGAKPVCERGACGACTVHLDGAPVNACMMLALDAAGHELRTVEGLAQGGALAPIQRAFIEHDALQCGFCTPGMVMACAALLEKNPHPTLDEVKHAVSGNLCRCGTYPKVFEAALSVGRRA